MIKPPRVDRQVVRRQRNSQISAYARNWSAAMWIVRVALRRPYTFIVLALLLGIIGPLAVLRTPTDIFPNINIPVVSVIWTYSGLPPKEMSDRITGNFERFTLVAVNNIEHIE